MTGEHEAGAAEPWVPAIAKPLRRSHLRRLLGREWHIAKRRAQWSRADTDWAEGRADEPLAHIVHAHRTALIRPLPTVR